MICVSIGNGTLSDALKILEKSGFVEIRADLLNWPEKDYTALISAGRKTIFTCRPGKISDNQRLSLFEMAITSGATFIDVEIESDQAFIENVQKIIAGTSTELVISYHNFEMTPSAGILEEVLENCYNAGADVAKIACRVYSPADAARLLSLYAFTGRKVVLGMGKAGKITRLASSFLGAEFTFASSGEGEATAEGQFTFNEMKEIIQKIQ